MIPVDQTLYGKRGNCMAASMASLLECPLEMLPPVPVDKDPWWPAWWAAVANWLLARGLYYIEVLPKTHDPVGFHLMCGPSDRTWMGERQRHAVVGKDGRMVHDPHRDRSGLTKVETYGLLVVSDWRMLKADALVGAFKGMRCVENGSFLHEC